MINYEITKVEPLSGQLHIVYSRTGNPDYLFAQALPSEFTEASLHETAKHCAQFAETYWTHWNENKDNTITLQSTTGQTKSIVREPSPDHDTLTEKLEEVVTETETTITYSHNVVPRTLEEKGIAIRQKRAALLKSTDLYGLADRGTAQEWLDYRQALRDLPQQETFPASVVWPIKPLEG